MAKLQTLFAVKPSSLISVQIFVVVKRLLFFSLVKRCDMYIMRELFFRRTDSRESIISGLLPLHKQYQGYHYLKK